jgi:hypothetical protein
VRVYEEPDPQPEFYIDTGGVLYDTNEEKVDLSTCPVGVWVKLKDVIPETADLSLIAAPGLNFIESAEYTPSTGRYRPTPRSTPGPYDLTGESAVR